MYNMCECKTLCGLQNRYCTNLALKLVEHQRMRNCCVGEGCDKINGLLLPFHICRKAECRCRKSKQDNDFLNMVGRKRWYVTICVKEGAAQFLVCFNKNYEPKGEAPKSSRCVF
ncbi:hypothetical protein GOODEAATRI_033291 [Goodea atripinnis]|uniref:Uncharacterized protein n=1 Tax=Goodea atripinnis TaxID=208336 RepID=A0ABV0PTN0_9TELE